MAEDIVYKPFTGDKLSDRLLIIAMLQFEDSIILGQKGKELYSNPRYKSLSSLKVDKTINRIVLTHFGFSNKDSDVENYRKIFRTYYRSPTDYDAEVLKSVAYMRENKCMFYLGKEINIGDKIPDSTVFRLDGKKTSIFEQIERAKATGKFDKFFVAGFSIS